MFQARVRFKLLSKQKPLATGGIAQSQRASINDAVKKSRWLRAQMKFMFVQKDQ